MIFLNSLDLLNHAEVTLLALTVSKPVGSCVHGPRGRPPHDPHIRTLRTPAEQHYHIFPYFPTHSSQGLTCCLIARDRGRPLSRCLHRAVHSDPRVFFPSGSSSFKAQQRVRGARTAPSRVCNPALGRDDFHLPLCSTLAVPPPSRGCLPLPPPRQLTLRFFSRLLTKIFRHAVTMRILRAVQHQHFPRRKADA